MLFKSLSATHLAKEVFELSLSNIARQVANEDDSITATRRHDVCRARCTPEKRLTLVAQLHSVFCACSRDVPDLALEQSTMTCCKLYQ